jgi:hypothetical protein
MKTFTTALTAALAMLALIAMPVQAQTIPGSKRHANEQKAPDPDKQVDEKAYNAALKRIPEPKEKYDPWGVARPDPAKDAKKP